MPVARRVERWSSNASYALIPLVVVVAGCTNNGPTPQTGGETESEPWPRWDEPAIDRSEEVEEGGA